MILFCVPVLVQTLCLSSVRLLTVRLKQAFYNSINIAAFLDGPIVRGWTLFRLCGTVQKLHLSRDICIESMEELRGGVWMIDGVVAAGAGELRA